MFGKKKPAVEEKVDAVCKVCGTKCMDQIGLERHVSWAHPASKIPAGTPEKKA